MLWVWASSGFKDKTIVPSSGVLQCQTALWPLITYVHFYPSFERVRKWDTEISHIWQVNWKTKEQISPGIYTFHPETKHRMCKNGQDDWPTNSPTLQSVSSVSVFEYRMCWKNKPAPITLQDLPCVISLHVWNGWVVTDIWCEFDVNLIFRNILENLENWWCAQYFVSPPHHLDHLSEEQTHNTNSRV